MTVDLLSDLTLDWSFKVKPWQPNIQILLSQLLLFLEVWIYVQPKYRKSEAVELLMVLDFFKIKLLSTLKHQNLTYLCPKIKFWGVMQCRSFDEVRFQKPLL